MFRHLMLMGMVLSGCVNLEAMQRDHKETEKLFATATELNAKECTPKEYALAQVHLEFTELEFRQGDPRRARDHMDIALANARYAAQTAPSCIPKDRDEDGITDDRDDCPDEPEDFDGVADEDGCPDIVLDSDGDGILDDQDQCPQQAEDLDGFKDPDGCPDPDNDGDGVLDESDDCPMQPEDLDGFEDTDGCPESDNDSDGFPDTTDQCPDTPGPKDGCPETDADGDGFLDEVDECPVEPGVAPNGCPIRDRDGDGFNDDVDPCPDNPENFNEYLDDDGCPDIKPQKVKIANRQIVISEQIKFQSGKAIIRTESYDIIDAVVQVLKDYPQIEVRIEGHTDSDGADANNLELSKRRADAVFEYIIDKDVEARRLSTEGFGETKPIDTNRTAEGKANNRRVEFHITKGLD